MKERLSRLQTHTSRADRVSLTNGPSFRCLSRFFFLNYISWSSHYFSLTYFFCIYFESSVPYGVNNSQVCVYIIILGYRHVIDSPIIKVVTVTSESCTFEVYPFLKHSILQKQLKTECDTCLQYFNSILKLLCSTYRFQSLGFKSQIASEDSIPCIQHKVMQWLQWNMICCVCIQTGHVVEQRKLY